MRDLDNRKQVMKKIETASLDVDLIGSIIALKDYNYKDKELIQYLDEILKEKYRDIFKGEDEDVLKKIISYTNYRSHLYKPLDFIRYNNMLFCNETILDDCLAPSKSQYFIVADTKHYDIDDIDLRYAFAEVFENKYHVHHFQDNKKRCEALSRALTVLINNISREQGLGDIVLAVSKHNRNKDELYFGMSGCMYKGTERVIVDFTLEDLMNYIYYKKTSSLDMTIVDEDNLQAYSIVQSPSNEKILNWDITKKELEKWNFNLELKKAKSKVKVLNK